MVWSKTMDLQNVAKGFLGAAGGLTALLLGGDARAQLNYDAVQADLAAKGSLAAGYTCTLTGTISEGVVTCSDSNNLGIVGVIADDKVNTIHFVSGGETTKTEVYNNDVLQSTTTFKDKNPLMRETYDVDGTTVISREVNDDADQFFDRGESFSAVHQKTKLHPTAIAKAAPFASRLSVSAIGEALARIAAAEKSLHTKSMDGQSIITMLIIGLTR